MLADFFTDHPVLTALAAVLALLLLAGFVWIRRQRAGDTWQPPTPPRTPPPVRPAPLPPLSIASFAPLPPRAAAPVPAPPPRAAAPGGPASLLVVDDSAVARAKLRKLFEGAGYLVDIAADGDEALALVGSKRYAVLVTDLEMPKLNGFQLIAEVQASPTTDDLPIIAITGHDELSARVHDMKGLYGLFKKPWNDSELLQRVANVATLRRPAASG